MMAHHTPLEGRPERAFALALAALVLAVFIGGLTLFLHYRDGEAITKAKADAAQQQVTEERKTLCGGFVPISKLTLPPHVTSIGINVVQWAKDSAAHLHCPADSKP